MQHAFSSASLIFTVVLAASPALAQSPHGPTQHGRSGLPSTVASRVQPSPAKLAVIKPLILFGNSGFYDTVLFDRLEQQPVIVPLRQIDSQPRLQPLSFTPADPNATVARLPSGRIAVTAPPGSFNPTAREQAEFERQQRPYAPPSFQIIGAPSRRHQGKPVALSYGEPPKPDFNPDPRVIWLDRRGR